MTLRTRLSESDILLAPGIYDPLTAAIAEAEDLKPYTYLVQLSPTLVWVVQILVLLHYPK